MTHLLGAAHGLLCVVQGGPVAAIPLCLQSCGCVRPLYPLGFLANSPGGGVLAYGLHLEMNVP